MFWKHQGNLASGNSFCNAMFQAVTLQFPWKYALPEKFVWKGKLPQESTYKVQSCLLTFILNLFKNIYFIYNITIYADDTTF